MEAPALMPATQSKDSRSLSRTTAMALVSEARMPPPSKMSAVSLIRVAFAALVAMSAFTMLAILTNDRCQFGNCILKARMMFDRRSVLIEAYLTAAWTLILDRRNARSRCDREFFEI